ncbi:E3 ubiquitin-protein ligase TTC3 [Notolabrus celidotus]|uniref:E3 ubiquitin-protein ligase TTC3 n=1 Tax=Notolabrus celidotus TaxID=1203425 RepID=UPI00148F6B2D|nr:E3 ubiquitin-protein ligase TTC3 [Notolabrus celidotus]
MSDSDSDSDCSHECCDFGQRMKAKLIAQNIKATTFNPSDEIIDEWSTIPWDIKVLATQRMKLCAFWLPTVLQRDSSSQMTLWALEIGLINSNEDISMKQLHRIETVEAVLRALEKGTLKADQTKQVFWISNMFNLRSPEAYEDAVRWLERSGEHSARQQIEDFGHFETGYTALLVLFTEFARYIHKMSSNLQRTMNTLLVQPSALHKEKSDEMKKKGNEKFQSQLYDEAIKFYSKAIKYNPENHIIYGNRALCFIRSKKYIKAMGDGKRACLVQPLWAKGHYRYCEALFLLGELKMAIEANGLGRHWCKDDQEGLRDLEQQRLKFVTELQQVEQLKKNLSKKPNNTHKAQAAESKPQSFKVGAVMRIPPQNMTKEVKSNKQPEVQNKKQAEVKNNKQPEVKNNKQPEVTANKQPEVTANKQADVKNIKQAGKNEKTTQAESTAKASKPAKSQPTSKSEKGESSTAVKKKSKNKNIQSETEKPKAVGVKAAVCEELKSMVQDAHTALSDDRSRNAEQSFSQALVVVEANNPKELGLSTLDVLLLLYGRALALTEIGQPEELGEAQRLLEKVKSFEERTFQCLVFYAIGRVFVRENRFAVALEKFSDSMQMVKNQITPGKLTWPLTKEIVKETQPDYFKEILENNLEMCKFPPIPDAVCRLEKCLGSSKAEIYFTDPDFKGFIQMSCCQSCMVEYHMTCWKTLKTLKTSPVFEKSEKDFLLESCFTPDCVGKICGIKIYGPTGLVKCKFEATIPKPVTPKKPRVNQTCTSLKNIKSKEERKLRRKQHKQSFQEKQVISNEILQKKEDSASQAQQKDWLLYRDRVLLQISQTMELLREEKGLPVSTLTDSLKPWLELDSSRGNKVAGRLLNWQQEQLETLGQAVELLLERKNRVWARVVVEVLSGSLNINPKLYNWACQLNSAGLNAAKSFIERHAGHLEQLDLAFLLNFSPLQEVIIDKLGTRLELFSNAGLTVTEYLKQAQPHDMRLFIWTLEEHRDVYASCHSILDEYFDMMDGHCSVLKKSDENQNNSPMKSRGRKKKNKESKGVYVRSVTPRDDFDQDYFEDDSLSFLHPGDPFSVPSHLRDQVAAFEEQYSSSGHRGGHYKSILDNNPDTTKETLYDYFAQILEEHGPLVAEDRLLVGELENFPPAAQQKIQEAGGFEIFLLESLRFIKMGQSIGLTKHAVSLQQSSLDDLDNLDDLDDIMDPYTNGTSSAWQSSHEAVFKAYLERNPSSQVYPILPSPYVFVAEPPPHVLPGNGDTQTGNFNFPQWSTGEEQVPYIVPNDCEEADLYCSGGEDGLMETDSSSVLNEEGLWKRHAAVQTSQETMRSVAVNTELHERFETLQGDINKRQKKNQTLAMQIQKMSSSCDEVDLKHKEDLAVLEDDIQKITANIQVTKKELTLFQQKLEEEVKKDQNEKKANQEVLKALKVEIEDLQEEHRSLTRNIREKKSSFDSQLRDFLELSNQSAAEKMSLEDEIRRCKTSLTSATRRCNNAQLSVVESSRDQSLYGLYRELATNKASLSKLDEAAHRFPNQDLEMTQKTWRANVQEIEKKISTIETQFKEQMDQVKNGRRVNELLPVSVSNQHEPPAAAMSVAAALSSSSSSSSSPSLTQQAAAEAPAAPPQTQHRPAGRASGPSHTNNTVFDKAMEHLASMFPDYTRPELMRFVQELRSSSGGSLSSMALQDMVGGVSQLILDHQERSSAYKPSLMGRGGSPAQSVTPPLMNPSPVWQTFQTGPQRATQSNALNVEDPCIICHEDMSPDTMCVLECRHSFHNDCIRSWLKEQSTCPTCRDHALLPEDFPVLPGRRRQAP